MYEMPWYCEMLDEQSPIVLSSVFFGKDSLVFQLHFSRSDVEMVVIGKKASKKKKEKIPRVNQKT